MADTGTRVARLAWRLLLRDCASGRMLIMLLATVIAVGSTVSVSLLVARVERVLLSESSALLAADLAIVGTSPPRARYRREAGLLGLRVAQTAVLRSVVAHGDELQLVQLKAASDGYPLRGDLTVAEQPMAAAQTLTHGPVRGEVWADAKLFALLGLTMNDSLTIGRLPLRLSKVLVLEPDRAGDLFALAPRVLMHADDLAATGLILPGSRVTYTTLIAGTSAAIGGFRRQIELAPGDALMDPRNARPEMRAAFAQAERFLSLAAFAGVLLAAIGIALAAAGYAEHHEASVAVFKTLGLTRREVLGLLSFELFYLALLAAAAGGLLALALHGIMLERFIADASLGAAPPLWPLLHGLLIAVASLFGFGMPALARLSRMPVTAIFARDRDALPRPTAWAAGAMGLALLLIAPWHVGSPKLVILTLAGMIASALLLAAAAYVLVRLMGRLRQRTRMSWRFGLANIARRARLSVMQTTAVGLGIAVILLLGLVRDDLVQQWTERLPPDAPNHFLINIQGDELGALQEFLVSSGFAPTRFYPMVRGRLTAINGRPVVPDDYSEPRARRLADREFNLSWATDLKADNSVTDGRWWKTGATGEMSVEEGIAETLGMALGDELLFTVAEREVRGRVTNLRHVDWDNFQVNFFVVSSPDLLQDAPATYITSFRVDPTRLARMARLVERFPSVTVIDVEALLRQVRQVMQRVASALLWVFLFALAAGGMVLAAAVQASQRERVQDAVLLKTLGASRRFVRRAMTLEFALLGVLAGAIGSLGALGTGWALATMVLDIPYRLNWHIPAAGILSGVVGFTLIGIAVADKALRRPVMRALGDTL